MFKPRFTREQRFFDKLVNIRPDRDCISDYMRLSMEMLVHPPEKMRTEIAELMIQKTREFAALKKLQGPGLEIVDSVIVNLFPSNIRAEKIREMRAERLQVVWSKFHRRMLMAQTQVSVEEGSSSSITKQFLVEAASRLISADWRPSDPILAIRFLMIEWEPFFRSGQVARCERQLYHALIVHYAKQVPVGMMHSLANIRNGEAEFRQIPPKPEEKDLEFQFRIPLS